MTKLVTRLPLIGSVILVVATAVFTARCADELKRDFHGDAASDATLQKPGSYSTAPVRPMIAFVHDEDGTQPDPASQCTVTVIGRCIVTAAHCLVRDDRSYVVMLAGDAVAVVDSKAVLRHESFEPDSEDLRRRYADIAIARLKTKPAFRHDFSILAHRVTERTWSGADDTTAERNATNGTAYGFGDQTATLNRRELRVLGRPLDEAKQPLPALVALGDVESTNGDSGGPWYAVDRMPKIVGIHSAHSDAGGRRYQIAVEVAAYHAWLEERWKILGCGL